jgi:hypothetical protein
MSVRVIIAAAGSGVRWGNFRGTQKHLAVVEGEVLLERTVKQFLKYTDDVCIIGADDNYKVDGASLYVVKSPNTNWKDGAKFMSSSNLWLREGRTVIVFGDVYFTNDAVKTIMTNSQELMWFLRTGESKLTGCKWKEIFALAFNGSMTNTITQRILQLISLDRVQSQAAWVLYGSMLGPTTNGLFNNSHFTAVDDWTEDFDFPEDLVTWEENRKEHRKKKKQQPSET